jgi:hypothetical protein
MGMFPSGEFDPGTSNRKAPPGKTTSKTEGTRSIAVSGHTRQKSAHSPLKLAIFPKRLRSGHIAHFLAPWHLALFFLGFPKSGTYKAAVKPSFTSRRGVCPYGFVRRVERC